MATPRQSPDLCGACPCLLERACPVPCMHSRLCWLPWHACWQSSTQRRRGVKEGLSVLSHGQQDMLAAMACSLAAQHAAKAWCHGRAVPVPCTAQGLFGLGLAALGFSHPHAVAVRVKSGKRMAVEGRPWRRDSVAWQSLSHQARSCAPCFLAAPCVQGPACTGRSISCPGSLHAWEAASVLSSDAGTCPAPSRAKRLLWLPAGQQSRAHVAQAVALFAAGCSAGWPLASTSSPWIKLAPPRVPHDPATQLVNHSARFSTLNPKPHAGAHRAAEQAQVACTRGRRRLHQRMAPATSAGAPSRCRCCQSPPRTAPRKALAQRRPPLDFCRGTQQVQMPPVPLASQPLHAAGTLRDGAIHP